MSIIHLNENHFLNVFLSLWTCSIYMYIDIRKFFLDWTKTDWLFLSINCKWKLKYQYMFIIDYKWGKLEPLHSNISYANQYITLFTNNEVDPNNYLYSSLSPVNVLTWHPLWVVVWCPSPWPTFWTAGARSDWWWGRSPSAAHSAATATSQFWGC